MFVGSTQHLFPLEMLEGQRIPPTPKSCLTHLQGVNNEIPLCKPSGRVVASVERSPTAATRLSYDLQLSEAPGRGSGVSITER